jgi:GNAT superfamily N-acetyltransferase
MSVHITGFDRADDPAAVAAHEVVAAACAQDLPDFPPYSRAYHLGRLTHPWPDTGHEHSVARLGDEVAGTLSLSFPEADNLHLAEVELTVHPAYRRRGVGRALHAHAVARARARGRRLLIGEYTTTLPGGAPRDSAFQAFAEAVGAKAALPEVRRRLDLDTADTAGWEGLLTAARPHAEGYSTVWWTDAVPEAYAADVAALDSRLVLDAPMGDLDMEAPKIDADRHRAGERTHRAWGRHSYHVGGRHDATDRLVAWTFIGLDADTLTHAWQQITIVDPAHRGHRLGIISKVENLRQVVAAEPALRHINTWNAQENAHMIAINEQLGFRAIDGWVCWQQEI